MEIKVDESALLLNTKINSETAKMSWHELQRYFARGVVLLVAADADLVDVAVSISEDKKCDVEALMSTQKLRRMSDEDARGYEHEAVFWAVVIAPWVLVQVASA